MRRALIFAFFTGAASVSAACNRSPQVSVTFNRDVAPILFANCASCHRPGEVAPFPLLTFADARAHAEEIAEETRERHMPPWLPEPGAFPLAGTRRLTDAQIAVLQQWFKAGSPEGNAADRPSPPSWPDGWQLGKPDRVLTAARAYVLAPGDGDVYRNVVLRTSLPATAFVRGVEFGTGGAPIHHAVIRLDRTAASRGRDGADGQAGFDGMAWQSVQDPDGHFIGWAPGRGPILAPDGMPWRLEPGSDLVIELHMIPGHVAVEVRPSVALFLAGAPPVRTPVTVKMGSKRIDIPAGARGYSVTDTYELPVDVELLSLYPHAHYLGKEMKVTAAMPDRSEKLLLHIRQWDFHWQQDYRFVSPVALPRGARLTMHYTYDNSDANADNPNRPPQRVQVGPRSVDEMANLGLQVLTKTPADALVLTRAFEWRDKLENVMVGEKRVREMPNVAEHLAFLGGSYVEVGRFADAIPPLEQALRLDPRSASAHNYLGGALVAVARVPQAIEHLRTAARLDPGDERIHFNLGNAFSAAGRPAEAHAAYTRALSINPQFAEAHGNLGALLFGRGRVAEALRHLERAVTLKPDSAGAESDLGGALAAAGRFDEALTHVRRALVLDPAHGPARENLRRLEARRSK
jgi:tetratricopeptide (TPR) repeat protein/mono/diheme cytochrome c family protein